MKYVHSLRLSQQVLSQEVDFSFVSLALTACSFVAVQSEIVPMVGSYMY